MTRGEPRPDGQGRERLIEWARDVYTEPWQGDVWAAVASALDMSVLMVERIVTGVDPLTGEVDLCPRPTEVGQRAGSQVGVVGARFGTVAGARDGETGTVAAEHTVDESAGADPE